MDIIRGGYNERKSEKVRENNDKAITHSVTDSIRAINIKQSSPYNMVLL